MIQTNWQKTASCFARRLSGRACTMIVAVGAFFAATGRCAPAGGESFPSRASISAAFDGAAVGDVTRAGDVPDAAQAEAAAEEEVPEHLRDLRFTAIHMLAMPGPRRSEVVSAAVGEFSVRGPIVETLRPAGVGSLGYLAAVPGGSHHLVSYGPLARIDAETGAFANLEAEYVGRVPRLGGVKGIAYDTKRRRLMVWSGDDYLYTFSPQTRRWGSRKEMTVDTQGFACAADEDAFYAVDLKKPDPYWKVRERMRGRAPAEPAGHRIHKLDAEGNLLSTVKLSGTIPYQQYGFLPRPSGIQVAYARGHLVLLTPPRLAGGTRSPASIYVVAPASGRLEYSSESRPRNAERRPVDFQRPQGDPAPAIQARVEQLDKAITALQAQGRGDWADQLAERLQAVQRMLAGRYPAAAEGPPEVHAVGVHDAREEDDEATPGTVEVRVSNVGAPAILVLCGFRRLRWNVRLTDGARIEKVLLGGSERQEVAGLPKDTAVIDRTWRRDPEHWLSMVSYDDDFKEFRAVVHAQLQAEVMTLQYLPRYQGEPVVIGPSNQEWRTQHVLSLLRRLQDEIRLDQVRGVKFRAICRTGGEEPRCCLGEFTLDGPVPATLKPLSTPVEQLATDPRGPTDYGLRGPKVYRIDAASGKADCITTEETIPDSLRGTGLTMDTRRHRLLAYGTKEYRNPLGGGTIYGRYMFGCDPGAENWTTMAQSGFDVGGLAYVEEEDLIYGLKQAFRATTINTLCKLNPHGAMIDTVPLSRSFTWQPTDGSPQLIAAQGRLIIVTPPKTILTAKGKRCVSEIYLVDRRNGQTAYAGRFSAQ